jgi:hypothetical protein
MAAPSNGSRLKGGEWLRSTLDAQRAAFAAQPMPGASMRREQLKRLKAALLTHKDALAAAESRDFGGHSLDEVMISEILPLIAEIDHAIRRVESWMRPSRRRVGIAFLPSSASVVHQPLGVVDRTAGKPRCGRQPRHDQDVRMHAGNGSRGTRDAGGRLRRG